MNTESSKPTFPSGRLLSLDAFRGFTMMSMVLVNNPGNGEYVYAPLEHAKWNGCTFTDLIFPFFLFIVGVAMPFSFAKRTASGESRAPLIKQIIRRSLIIFGLGLLLNWFPYFDIIHGRIPGVLQRIAICYFIVSWMAIGMSTVSQAITGFILLAVYWIGMLFIPVPGYGAGIIEPVGNLGWWIDSHLLAGHTWPHAPAANFDPEGVWSTLPAIVTALSGYFTGTWLRTQRDHAEKVIGMFIAGNIALVVGYFLSHWMPYNKNLWTVPYTLHTAGLALNGLAMFYFFIDMRGCRRFITPFLIYGSNAIFIYVGSGIIGDLMGIIQVGSGAEKISISEWIYQHIFSTWLSPINASLGYALAYVLLWLIVTAFLYRRRIFIKI